MTTLLDAPALQVRLQNPGEEQIALQYIHHDPHGFQGSTMTTMAEALAQLRGSRTHEHIAAALAEAMKIGEENISGLRQVQKFRDDGRFLIGLVEGDDNRSNRALKGLLYARGTDLQADETYGKVEFDIWVRPGLADVDASITTQILEYVPFRSAATKGIPFGVWGVPISEGAVPEPFDS